VNTPPPGKPCLRNVERSCVPLGPFTPPPFQFPVCNFPFPSFRKSPHAYVLQNVCKVAWRRCGPLFSHSALCPLVVAAPPCTSLYQFGQINLHRLLQSPPPGRYRACLEDLRIRLSQSLGFSFTTFALWVSSLVKIQWKTFSLHFVSVPPSPRWRLSRSNSNCPPSSPPLQAVPFSSPPSACMC